MNNKKEKIGKSNIFGEILLVEKFKNKLKKRVSER